MDLRFFATALLAGGYVQDSVGINQKPNLNARQAGRHGRNSLQVEARERTAIPCQFALSLQHVDGNVRLPVDLRCVKLSGRGRNCGIPENDLVGHAARDFNAQRQWSDVEQQHVLGCFRAAAQNVGLHGGPQGHDFVRIQVGMWHALKEALDELAHFGNPC